MEYRNLGTTGIQISALCFGTMSFGGDADRQESEKMFGACLDAGINAFDCANVYQNGVSEELLGDFMKGRRRDLVITSKAYFPMGDGVNDRGASRRNIRLSIADSFRRLKTDFIDIYFIHKFDEACDLTETLETLSDIVREGKSLYIGLSNFAAWQVSKAMGIAALRNLIPPHVIQPMYSLVKRQAEVELLPMAVSEGLGVLSYSPLGGGLLTGKFSSEDRPAGTRIASNKMYGLRYGDESYYRRAGEFTSFAGELGVHPATLAVAWAKSRPGVTAPIIGARNLTQLRDSLAAADYVVDGAVGQRLDSICPPPPPATDRSEEHGGFGYEKMLK